ncbi:MAG: damage-inducible protein CinA [Gammaproteobacteria bacterium (ex Lamellibrachia satsuma)]|nr:MAG: nicotinamide-nucleotide amidase [Gammaproteobacteria bacterium (ex Lamellibrachia satsuma)]RRS32037.1 MAG: damage-inducible protein CinA [Gammaproteobacteria bacterium (ex Lamellibrachia satsuma)]
MTSENDLKLALLADDVGMSLQQHGFTLVLAESCTGGWVAKALTDIPGSSAWFDRGFVTYSNAAKQEMLGVDVSTIGQWGAVSEQVAAAMTNGALVHSRADVAIAISGIAGPSGGSAEKPVGTVCFSWQLRSQEPAVKREHFSGDREAVRLQSVFYALEQLIEVLAANG